VLQEQFFLQYLLRNLTFLLQIIAPAYVPIYRMVPNGLHLQQFNISFIIIPKSGTINGL